MNLIKRLSVATATILMATAFVACNGSDTPNSGDEGNKPTIGTLTSDITSATQLEAKTYILNGSVRVKKGASLTIPAGTIIKTKQGFDQFILVEQVARLLSMVLRSTQ